MIMNSNIVFHHKGNFCFQIFLNTMSTGCEKECRGREDRKLISKLIMMLLHLHE